MKKWIALLLLIVIAAAIISLNASIPKQGYYYCSEELAAYYFQGGRWYSCVDGETWHEAVSVSSKVTGQWKKWYLGVSYPSKMPAPDFTSTAFYADHVREYVYDSGSTQSPSSN